MNDDETQKCPKNYVYRFVRDFSLFLSVRPCVDTVDAGHTHSCWPLDRCFSAGGLTFIKTLVLFVLMTLLKFEV